MAYFQREGVMLTWEQLQNEATSHYVSQAVKQAYVLLLGLDVLGNPYGLIKDFTKGLGDFFYEPFMVSYIVQIVWKWKPLPSPILKKYSCMYNSGIRAKHILVCFFEIMYVPMWMNRHVIKISGITSVPIKPEVEHEYDLNKNADSLSLGVFVCVEKIVTPSHYNVFNPINWK